jgi:rhamnosyl/mannosyltransferase
LKIYAPFLESILKRADQIIATSENYINHSPFLSRYKSKCSVIPLSIHADNFTRNKNTNINIETIYKKYGDGPFVLFTGRLASYKGVNFLIEAMKGVEAKLLIVGDGPQNLFLKEMTAKIGLGNRVFFCGAVEEKLLPSYYHSCEVFVLPSVERSEAFGIVQLEAMACAKPVVSTDLESGVPFVNQHRKTGIIVPPKNASAISAAINELLKSENLRKEYGGNGIKRVAELFAPELMIRKTLEVYNKII